MTQSAQKSPPSRGAVRPQKNISRAHFLTALPYLAPAAILCTGFVAYPTLQSVRLSFYNWNGYRTVEPEFVGTSNYVRLLTADPVFWTAFVNTIIWVVLSLLVPVVLSLILALALNRAVFGKNLFRSVFYMPAVFASITVAAVWRWIYNPVAGAVNQVLEMVGLGSLRREWLGDPEIALYSIFVASIWQAVGFGMVLYLAGLQQLSADLIDAARIDGANSWRVFWHVTLPSLKPTTLVVVVLTIIQSLKVYDLVVGMTGGGPAQSTQVLALWSVTQSLQHHNFGLGSATATILLIISLAVVVPYLVWSLREKSE